MEAGEAWVYQEKAGAPFVEARIIRIGNKQPLKVKIGFVDDEYEGATEWVPHGRLKIPWEDRQAYLSAIDEWAKVAVYGRPPAHERDAAWDVYIWCLDESIGEMYYNGAEGVTQIHDVDALAALVHWPPADLTGSEGALFDDEDWYVGWLTTKRIAATLASLNPGIILRQIRLEEDRDHAEIVEIAQSRAWSSYQRYETVLAEILAKYNPKRQKVRDVLREWCGEPAVNLDAINRELRVRMLTFSALARDAAAELRAKKTQKAHRLADALEAAVVWKQSM